MRNITRLAILLLCIIGAVTLTAVETDAATFTVINTANSGPGSLRQAVFDANASGNIDDTIVFTANVRGKILLTGNSAASIHLNKPINTNLTIEGPGADLLSIESNFAFRIFMVDSGNVRISGLRISRGFANGDVSGGGIFVVEGANLTLEKCTIAENVRGGIGTMSGATLTINNCMITGNFDITGNYLDEGIKGAGVLDVSNSTIADNAGYDGAGISWLNGTVTLTNVTVAGNRGFESGGITFNTSTAKILNSTITNNGNVSPQGLVGGLKLQNGATVEIKNTIIANNLSSTVAEDVSGTVVSQGNNLIGDTTGGSGFIASDLLNANPRLGGFANNGGATYTISLLSTSPAIDAGNDNGAPATDQRGIARPAGAAVDIGAYERFASPAPFGKIVFVSDRNGNREIYSMDSDATDQTRLTTNIAIDEFPDWSPDGAGIAFATDRDGNFEIYSMNADGTTPTRLTNNSVPDSEPAFSPDGSKIAFVRNGAGIFLMDANGANQTAVPNAADGGSPSWSPDGTQIVFTCINAGSAICKIDSDGTHRAPFLFNDALHYAPAWSPDGDSIVASIDFDIDPFLYYYNPYNVDVLRAMLASSEIVAFAPAFSPDGAKLAYNNLSDTGGDLYMRDADGGNPVLLIDRIVSGNGNSSHADWFGLNTPASPGPITVVSGTTSISFTAVTIRGTTTVDPYPPPGYPPAYACTAPPGGRCKLPSYNVGTSASYTPPLTICVKVPSVSDASEFARLRILHYVNGVATDETILPPNAPAPNFATRTICARSNSLSPFVVAEQLAPTAAHVSVGGRVSTADGRAVTNATVVITGSEGAPRTVRTNAFGYYRFNEVLSGASYLISVNHKQFQFDPRIVSVVESVADADFVAVQGEDKFVSKGGSFR